ncbi:MAG: hypothetical protein AB1894_21065 [Chloroflexota bacterium]
MERTVPSTGSEEIELYQRTYYSLLRSSAEVKIRTLEEAHAGMKSLLHPGARDLGSDMAAFIYCQLRLPACMADVQLIVLGQSARVFERAGYGEVSAWQEVFALARRRRCFFDGKEILACFIASRSDIDDIVPLLAAYQIEWNKLHLRLQERLPVTPWNDLSDELLGEPVAHTRLAQVLGILPEDVDRLQMIWGDDFESYLEKIAAAPLNLRLQLLSGSLIEYRRATHDWWDNIAQAAPFLYERPVYFVSSNTHSLVNILSGFALNQQEILARFLEQTHNVQLLAEWADIQGGQAASSRENFLYYLLKKYQQASQGRDSIEEQRLCEQELNILRVPSQRSFDVEAQVFELSRLNPAWFDGRLHFNGPGLAEASGAASWLAESDAVILNIDYPLGLSAFNLLAEVASQVGSVLGVYVMGKAATLNAVVGDVMISNVVHDEQSRNTYLYANCFSSADVAQDLVYGTVLDNQKSVSVLGTFLQNAHYMDVFYREGYTVIEMEAGPYLSAVYEMYRPKRHPIDELVNLYGLPFDLGILHYASDTPLGKGKNLGAGNLSYFGMDSTYAVSLAILRRIFRLEKARVQSQRRPRG